MIRERQTYATGLMVEPRPSKASLCHLEHRLAELEARWQETHNHHRHSFMAQTLRINRIGFYAPIGISLAFLLVFIHIDFFFLSLCVALGSAFYVELSSEDEDTLIAKRDLYLRERSALLKAIEQAQKAEATR